MGRWVGRSGYLRVLVSEIEYERYLSGASLEQEYVQTGIIELLGESQQKEGIVQLSGT